MTAPMTYLHIRGTLAENGVYRTRPGHESTRPGARGEGDPAYRLVLLDLAGRVLLGVAPQVRPRGCGSTDDPLRRRVRGVLPLHPDGAAFELRCGDVRLYGAAIPPGPPSIAAPRCRPSANGLTLHWQPAEPYAEPPTACGCEPAPVPAPAPIAGSADCPDVPTPRMTYSVVAAMASGRRITVARGLTGLSHRVDLSQMPVGGRGVLHLVASDGVRSSEIEVAPIDVPARPPTAHILAPSPGTCVPFGQPLSVLGCCLDMGGQPCAPDPISWSLDGEVFARGTPVAALDGLRPGAHHLTLAYGEPDGERVEVSVGFDAEPPDADHRQWEALVAGVRAASGMPSGEGHGLA